MVEARDIPGGSPPAIKEPERGPGMGLVPVLRPTKCSPTRYPNFHRTSPRPRFMPPLTWISSPSSHDRSLTRKWLYALRSLTSGANTLNLPPSWAQKRRTLTSRRTLRPCITRSAAGTRVISRIQANPEPPRCGGSISHAPSVRGEKSNATAATLAGAAGTTRSPKGVCTSSEASDKLPAECECFH